ncbi:hypothetical protein VTO73DRAFT_8888 [Trametes versicolor]
MSLLARHSPVFRDVFARPQPAKLDTDDDASMQGVPFVEVSDDVYDMSCMLHVIYDGPKYLNNKTSEMRFYKLSALMHMGHKYEIPDIFDTAARHLSSYYTTDLGSWIDFCGPDLSTQTFSFDKNESYHIVEVVNLARLTGKTSILPTALYRCCGLGVAGILKAGERDSSDPKRHVLSREDVALCLVARERLLRESGSIVGALAGAPCVASCISKGTCAQRMRDLEDAAAESMPGLLTLDVFETLEWRLRYGSGSENTTGLWQKICRACCHSLGQRYEAEQREMWGRFPGMFGLSIDKMDDGWGDATVFAHMDWSFESVSPTKCLLTVL